ncbi:hypothetical protein JXB01_04740 [Candidatus Micrarchaeota archaeon]|nr:hypothetical protein [Candidatus Micrarchaeota archaeon]
MPRGKKINIDMVVEDEQVDRLRSIDPDFIKKSRSRAEKSLSASVNNVFTSAKKLYQEKATQTDIQKNKLYSVQEAYDYLKDNGLYISFRAFGGRIERGTIPFVKIGRKRYIPKMVLEDILNLNSDFFTVREAFELYKKFNKRINYRAFIGRVEKGSVPSVKIGTRRLIPRDAVDALTHVSKEYYSVTQALERIHSKGIKIRRNAFERRLDRGRIPHVKIGGRRFIHGDVLSKLMDIEYKLGERKD